MLYPAIPFSFAVRKVVNEQNKTLYVTKIAQDAEDEFDIGSYIQTLAPDAGIYPEDLVCGITRKTVTPTVYERIKQSCGTLLVNDDKTYFFLDKAAYRTYVPRASLRRSSRASLRSSRALVAGAENKEWCAIQVPKYKYDCFKFIQSGGCSSFSVRDLLEMSNRLLLRLYDLHKQNVYHQDIKALNIAVTNDNELKFVDWGFCLVLPPKWIEFAEETNVDDTLIEEMNKSYKQNRDIWRIASGRQRYHYESLVFPEFLDRVEAAESAVLDDLDLYRSFGAFYEKAGVPVVQSLIRSIMLYLRHLDIFCAYRIVASLMKCKAIPEAAQDVLSAQFRRYARGHGRVRPFPESTIQEIEALVAPPVAPPVAPLVAPGATVKTYTGTALMVMSNPAFVNNVKKLFQAAYNRKIEVGDVDEGYAIVFFVDVKNDGGDDTYDFFVEIEPATRYSLKAKASPYSPSGQETPLTSAQLQILDYVMTRLVSNRSPSS